MSALKERIYQSARENVSKSRMNHILGVEALAKELAPRYGINEEDASLAALAHDLSKGIPFGEQIKKAQEWDLIAYPEDLEFPEVLHGRIAARILKTEYGVEKKDILEAVANHTLGRPGMSSLEMLIYSADMTEPGRDFPGVDNLRQKLYHDLTEGTLACMEQTLQHLQQEQKKIHPLTRLAYEDLKHRVAAKGGTNLEKSPIPLQEIVELIDDKKGHHTTVLDLRGISIIADYFILATGNTATQTKAITEHLAEKLPELGIPVLRKEGLPSAQWVLVDCGDLVIHIMTPDTREFYKLERLWGDAKVVEFPVDKA